MAADGEQEQARDPLSEALRMFQEIGGRLSDAARTIASDVAKSPAGNITEPLAQLAEQLAAMSTAWVSPVRAILDEQQALVDTIAEWAEQQRVLADKFAELADRHRTMTNQTMSLLGPLLEKVESLGGRAQDDDT